MRIYSLKRMTIPKVAVLATALAVGLLVATTDMRPAQAFPRAASCAACHGAATAGTVTAAPSTATPVAGATYTVAITLTANPLGGITGYGIVPVTAGTGSTFGGGSSAALAYTATMTAPAAAGTYSYTVWTNQGVTDGTARVGSVVYSITVAGPPPTTTTPPPTTTTPPPTTTTPPPTTTTPPVTTTTPPVTTTTPPVTTTTPPVTTALISGLSPKRGTIGSIVTINGSNFGTAGQVKFGEVLTTASSWSTTQIVFVVPEGIYGRVAPVTVLPAGDTASNSVIFRFAHVKAPRV